MNTYKFQGAYAFNEPFEKQFATDEEALQYRFRPDLVDGRWYASVWKKVGSDWLYYNDETHCWENDVCEK